MTTDESYSPDFRLKELAADPIPAIARPTSKSPGIESPSYVDPTYGVHIYKVTDEADFASAEFSRHDYSRRQAFNADNSRFIARTSDGYWLLYSAETFKVLSRSGFGGSMRGMAADAEAIWNPNDKTRLWYTEPYGGLVWWEKNVETDTDTVMTDFTGRLPWPKASNIWTKGEGTSSADGRYFAFMATSYDNVSKEVAIYGLFTYDRVEDRIVATLDSAEFGGAYPDHVSISPSGKYVVASWAYNRDLGTRAYRQDFSSYTQLISDSEHSDIAIGPDGNDIFVAASYRKGTLLAHNLETGETFDMMNLYPRQGANLGAMHISGQAFQRPGWIVVSTYGDSADYGKVHPDPTLEPEHRKVMLLELKPAGRKYSVAHTQVAAEDGGYFGEPQATVSRDGTRILFAGNFNDGGPPSDYLITLPALVYQ